MAVNRCSEISLFSAVVYDVTCLCLLGKKNRWPLDSLNVSPLDFLVHTIINVVDRGFFLYLQQEKFLHKSTHFVNPKR